MTIYQPTIAMGTFQNGTTTYQDTYIDGGGNIVLFNSVDSVAQTVENAIALWQGEYQYDTTIGTPWLNILGQQQNRLLLNSYIEKAVLSVNYVTSVISIDYVSDDFNRITRVIVKYYNSDNTVGVANATI